jgi:hypothetical protein
MKKVLYIILISIFSLTIISCGSSSDSGGGASTTSDDDTETTLTTLSSTVISELSANFSLVKSISGRSDKMPSASVESGSTTNETVLKKSNQHLLQTLMRQA